MLRVDLMHDRHAMSMLLAFRKHLLWLKHLDGDADDNLAARVGVGLQVDRLLNLLAARVLVGTFSNVQFEVPNGLLAAVEDQLEDGHLRLELFLVQIVLEASIHAQQVIDFGLLIARIERAGLGRELAFAAAPDAADFLCLAQLLDDGDLDFDREVCTNGDDRHFYL